jgi:Subtilase family
MTSMLVATAGFARRKAPSAGLLLMPLMAYGAIAAQWESGANAASPAAIRTVTLITGDRVVISGGEKQTVTVQPRKGREKIVFATTYQRVTASQREHLFVIPADAQPLISAGRLDRQLFDVTTLLESHYDDAQRCKLSLLVTYGSQVSALSVASTALPGATITNRFKSVNGVAASFDRQQLGSFWDSLTGGASLARIKKIWLDRVYQVVPDQSVPQIGAPLAWQGGYDGTEVACVSEIPGEQGCTLNRILEGMHWTVEERGSRIVSMSFGQPDDPDEFDPLEEAVEQLTVQHGVLFVIAAGKAGHTPGSAPAALTVGAADITAPGVGVVARAATILQQRHPDWSPAQLKSALMSTGGGGVDLPAALATSIVADTSSLNLGVVEFPHEDDSKIKRTVTYRNFGDVSIWLKFNIDVLGPDGAVAPEGMFSLDQTTLIVPAGSTARVTLTANTRGQAAPGLFKGKLLATGGGMSLSIPVAVLVEKPAFNVTVQHIDRNGALALDFVTTFVRLDEYMEAISTSDGILRLPAGRYAVQTYFYKDPVTLLLYPEFVLDAPATLTLDARNAAPLSVTPPTPTAKSFFVRTEYHAAAAWGSHAFGIQQYHHGEIYTGVVGQPAAHIRSIVNEHWKDPAQATSTEGAPLYTAVFSEPGTLITGVKTIPVADMAVVRARYAMRSPDPSGDRGLGIGVDVPGPTQIHAAFDSSVKFPHQRKEYYYSSDEDIRWHAAMTPDAFLSLDAPSRKYKPRQAYHSRWNEPPFAPVLPNYNSEVSWSYRTGDTMTVRIPILGDRKAHVISLPLDEDTGGKLALYRNGEKIAQVERGSSGDFQLQSVVAPEPAAYRIEADATQLLLPLSPRVRGVWTFQSEHVGETARLPLLTVRFNPSLNEFGEAACSTDFKIPISVYQLDQPEPVQVKDLSIEASFDDGVSWRSVPVSQDAGEWFAVLQHPKGAQYVSLRATATGRSANTAEITLIRAYALTDGGVTE